MKPSASGPRAADGVGGAPTSAGREVYFATCAPGLEPLLHAELRALRMTRTEQQVGGTYFEGQRLDAWRANLELRTATRVLLRLARFGARDADELHAGASAIEWERYLAPDGRLVVDARSRESALEHTRFVEQRVKDAVVDRLRTGSGVRLSVDAEDPDLRIDAHLFRDRCTLSIDTSGEALHKRGWRRHQGRAPLLDPFCGSGTLLVEAALLASGTPPGLFREQFGFERLPGHDAPGFAALRERLRARAHELPAKLALRGSDADAGAIEGARENLEAVGLAERVQLEVADARDFAPPRGWNGWIVSNLPYGVRVGASATRDASRGELDLVALHRDFGARVREHCAGYSEALLTGDPALARALGLRFDRRVALQNGALPCELLLARP